MYIKERSNYKYTDINGYDDIRNWNCMIAMGGPYLDGLKEVKKDLEAIDTLIETDFDKISNKNFYYLISRFFSVSLTIRELLNVISRTADAHYDKIELLNTRETFKTCERYGHGKDLDYIFDKYQVSWVVATARNFRLNPKYNYSQDEINSMKSKNQIVPLSIFPICINGKELPYKEKPINRGTSKKSANLGYIARIFQFYNFDNPGYFDDYYSNVGIGFSYFAEGNNELSKKVYNEICSMVKIRFNREQVLNVCDQIVSFLKNEYARLFYSIQRSYFYANSDKEQYLRLAKEIIEINDELSLKLKRNRNTSKTLRRTY